MLSNWGTEKIKANLVWNEIENKDAVIVAVIDTGFNINHPEFQGKIIDKYWDFDTNDNDVMGQSHGTSCLGLVLGINPYCKLLPLKALNSINGITDAINYCCNLKENGYNIRIISCSFIGGVPLYNYNKAIERAGKLGILIVAAAGNANKDNDKYKSYPSGYPFSIFTPNDNPVIDNVLAIGAVAKSNKKSSFSNFGKTTVDVSTPGEGLYTTDNNGYKHFSGTSAATPVASGAASLLFQYNSNFTPQDVRQILIDSVDYVGSLNTFSEGIINLERAFILAKNWDNNKAPIANNLNIATDKNKTITGKLTASDADSDNLTYFLAPEYYRGSLLLSKDGSFNYTPPQNYWGKDDFYYTVTDNKGKISTGKVTIEILDSVSTPQPPVTTDFIDISNLIVYAPLRDKGQYSFNSETKELKLTGQAWKCLNYYSKITANTVLEFSISGYSSLKWLGIGFDTNTKYDQINTTQFINFGTHRHGIKLGLDFVEGWNTYIIPIGQYFTGTFNYITFISDIGNSTNIVESYFKDLKLYDTTVESVACRFRRRC